LLYVALTRGQHRCTVVWGAAGDSATSALFWLLHAPDQTEQPGALRGCLKGMDDAALGAHLDALVARGAGSIRVDPLPTGRGERYRPRGAEAASLEAHALRRPVRAGGGLASFSALAGERGADGPDHDAGVAAAPTEQSPAERTGFTFPSGARAGSC